MSELRPCPFCGEEVFLLDVETRSSSYSKWDVYCRTHGCFLNSGTNNMFSNREDAILAWNTRIESPELTTLREQVKVLREALEEISQECVKEELVDGLGWFHEVAEKALAQTKPKNEDPEKLARLIASRVNGFGPASARKLVFRLRTLDNIINAEPADLDAIFGKGSIKSLHLRKYLSDPANVDHLRLGAQAKPKDGE